MFEKENFKIGEARYANSAEDSIIVLFWDDEDPNKEVMEMEVEKNPEDAYYKSLVDRGWTEEKLKEETAAWKLAQVRQINSVVDVRVNEKISLYKEKLQREFDEWRTRLEEKYLKEHGIKLEKLDKEFQSKIAKHDKEFESKLAKQDKVFEEKMQGIVTETFLNNTDADSLFKFKLAVFEIPQIKDASIDFKKRLRRAASIIECYAIVNEVYKDETK